ncbi:MAG: HAD-IC family P-type ATPase [Spirochaetota bacterium]
MIIFRRAHLQETVSEELVGELVSFQEIPGSGVEAQVVSSGHSYQIRVGSYEFTKEVIQDSKNMAVDAALGNVFVAANGEYFGYWLLEDRLREESYQTIQYLQKRVTQDIRIFSGDSQQVVSQIAAKLNIKDYMANLKPQDKLQHVKRLMQSNKKVVMVGDGMNDSPVLAQADVGISLQVASALSIGNSDLVLLQNSLLGVGKAIRYSKVTSRVIKENIILSLCYNCIMLPLAAMGYMLPVLCALFMTLSSLTVLANTFLLSWRARKK